MYCFFDTETTGLAKFEMPLTDPAQPHIAQFAMLLADENGREVSAFKTPIMPNGWSVDESLTGPDGKPTAYAINKIGNDLLNRYGVDATIALRMFRMYQDRATLKVAHNYRFDGFLVKALHEKLGIDPGPAIDKFCTMKAITEIMKLPPTDKMLAAGIGKPKSAKLSEAYKFCTGKDLEGAHDALADVRACKEVFFWIKRNGFYKEQPRVGPKEAA